MVGKSCIMFSFTEVLEKNSKIGLLQNVLHRIQTINSIVTDPKNGYRIYGEFCLMEDGEEDNTKYALVFTDYKDSKPRKRTMKYIKQWVFHITMGTISRKQLGISPSQEDSYNLGFAFRIINNLEKNIEQVPTILKRLLIDKIGDDPETIDYETKEEEI